MKFKTSQSYLDRPCLIGGGVKERKRKEKTEPQNLDVEGKRRREGDEEED